LDRVTGSSGKRIAIADIVVPGLVLRITPGGVKTFSVWYRLKGRRRRYTIPGRFPAVELAEARDRARDVLRRVRNGDDPQSVKIAARQALTFEDLAQRFIQAREPNLATSTATEYRRIVASYIHGSPLAGTRAPDISPAEVKHFLEGVARRAPVMGNRVYQLVRAVCRWSVREELLPSNPCEGLQRPRRERSRDRVLKDEEMVALWKALDGEPPEIAPEPRPVAGAVKSLLLLGQRSSETIEMRRCDLVFGSNDSRRDTREGCDGVCLVEHDHAIQTLATKGPDQPLDVGILPGTPRTGHDLWMPRLAIRRCT
jgi:integrase